MGWKRNKRTGEVVFVPDNAAPQPWVGKPTAPLEAPKMRGDIENTAAQTGKTIADTALSRQQLEINAREQALKERKFAAEENKRRAAVGKQKEQLKTQIMDLMNDILTIERIKGDVSDSRFSPGFGEVGGVAQVIRGIPGIGAASKDIDSRLGTLRSSIARSSLTKMRQESPTGASVGNPSDRDINLFMESRGPLNPDLEYGDFVRNLDMVSDRTWAELKKVSPKGAELLRQRMNGGQDDDALVNKYLRRGR